MPPPLQAQCRRCIPVSSFIQTAGGRLQPAPLPPGRQAAPGLCTAACRHCAEMVGKRGGVEKPPSSRIGLRDPARRSRRRAFKTRHAKSVSIRELPAARSPEDRVHKRSLSPPQPAYRQAPVSRRRCGRVVSQSAAVNDASLPLAFGILC